jgi:medium-chain acyl-[acyl-carrier-protein] hydrolase
MNGSSLFVTAQQKPEAEVRLICFPHAGGAPSSFFAWNALLGPRIECVSVQYPGRAQRWREPARSDVTALVEEIVNQWQEIPHGTFAFYGHSFGGLIAFEVARLLRRSLLADPEWLFVGASRAPDLGAWLPPIHELPDAEFVEAVQARYGGIPEQIRADREAMDLFLRPMRVDMQAYELYQMKEDAALSVPITVFAGAEDHSVPAHRMQGWEAQTNSEFEMKVLACGHFFGRDQLRTVTECIRQRLLPAYGLHNSIDVLGAGPRAETK